MVLTVVCVSVLLGALLERFGWTTFAIAQCTKFKSRKPRCRLVGAGPGDPSLLTRAALQALQEADLVIADRLISEDILSLIRGRIILSRKFKGCANAAQNELHDWTLDALHKGIDVVRLKGGDPFVYGRGAEEIEIFRNHGFDVEVIPGVSSSLCAPLAAGIAVTTRGVADQLLIATGHGMNDSIPREVAPYYIGRTTVFLMSVSRMHQLMHRLSESGYPDGTPVAVIEKAATKDQRVVKGVLAQIADTCVSLNVASPATIVVGKAVYALCQNDGTSHYQYGKGSVLFSSVSNL